MCGLMEGSAKKKVRQEATESVRGKLTRVGGLPTSHDSDVSSRREGGLFRDVKKIGTR